MLSSIIRFTIFIAVVLAITLGVNYLLVSPETDGVVITFRGYEQPFTPFMFVMVMLGIYLALYIAFRLLGFVIALLKFIAGDETAVTRYFDRANERKGLEALAQAMAAIAEGDARTARQKAQRAERLLKRPHVTRLINAQAFEMSGDLTKARAYYKALADDSDTSFVGVSGLMRIARAEGDRETALILARTAAGLRSGHAETLEALYTLQSEAYDWQGARVTLDAMKRTNLLDETEVKRRDSMLVLAQAADAEEAGQDGDALKHAVDAAKIDPSNPEAVEKAARMLAATNGVRQATKLIADAWKTAPSARLARVYADLAPDETPEERRKRFAELFSSNPGAPESHYARAELAIAEGDYAAAREALGKVEQTDPPARYCALMAAVIRGEGGPESDVRSWLAKGVTAPRGNPEEAPVDDLLRAAIVGSPDGGGPGGGGERRTAEPAA